jgi:hypothetical protein
MRYPVGFLYIFLRFNKLSVKRVFNHFLFAAIFILTSSLAHSFQLSLTWDPNNEPNIAGYKVYYGTVSSDYKFNVDVGKNTIVTISDLELSKTYYFAVTAYDVDGNESNFSAEISYKGPEQKSMPWIQLLLLND